MATKSRGAILSTPPASTRPRPAAKAPYIKGSQGTKPTPTTIPSKPVNFSVTQNTGLFPPAKPVAPAKPAAPPAAKK
jgi:hypothetical protein